MTTKKRHKRNNGVRKVCGCPRRQWAKCPHGWYFNFKVRGGTAYRFSVDKHEGRHIQSKTDAQALAGDYRKAIRAGTFGQPAPREAMTLQQLAETYLDRYVAAEHPETAQAFTWALATIGRTMIPRPTGGRAALGDWRVTDVTTDTIEHFRQVRRAGGTGIVGVNRHLGSLRAMFGWAVRVGYVEHTPFKRGTEAVIKLADEPTRSRRLNADLDEEAKLLAACGTHLRPVVECALETGMRRGEILSLQWSQVHGLTVEDDSTLTWAPRPEIVLPWTKTKTRRDRRVQVSSRLKSILEMRRFDPAGKPLPLSAYVFGTAIGTRVQSTKRAWMTAVLRAHGHTATYTATMNLSPASRAALAAIDLHFHDLRREAGSRWLEGGVPLHTIRDWLGHTNISQTSTYLAGTLATQHDAMRTYEARRVQLQRRATKARTGGRKSPRSATTPEKKLNKTAVGRGSAIM